MSPFCEWCEATEQLSVDHVIPVSERPDLAYKVENCRVLCLSCNGKRANNCTDDERATVLKRLQAAQARRAKFYASEREKTAQRGSQTRGHAPTSTDFRPVGKARSALHTPRRCA